MLSRNARSICTPVQPGRAIYKPTVSITKGHSFNRDSTSGNAVISVIVSSADSIAVSELDELKEWLKVRLNTETVEVSQR